MSTAVKTYQNQLKNAGFNPGVIDGDFGPKTLKASLDYQAAVQNKSVPEWLIWAAGEYGQKEIFGGKKHNPRIIHYHKFTSLGAKEDEVAWCASFVNAALVEGGGMKGTNNATAASFKTFGRECDPGDLGAILLIKTNTGSKRHVFFSAGIVNGTIFGLGGNQSNMVNVVEYPISKITESRYPIQRYGS